MSRLNREQVDTLLSPIKPQRIMHANGQSHVPAYDVAAHLTRIFGFGGWDQELLSCTLLFEDKSGTENRWRWTVGYSATVRLTIKNQDGLAISLYENGAAGDAVNQPSRADAHHLAMTSAISTAMKRCAAFGLGDQFGLSLYNKGESGALVIRTLVMPDSSPGDSAVQNLQDDIPLPQSLGNDERETSVIGDAPDADVSGGDSLRSELANEINDSDSRPARARSRNSRASNHSSDSSGLKGSDVAPNAPAELTPLQLEIRSHVRYIPMESGAKGAFLSDHAGYAVTSIRQLSDADCEQILAALRSLSDGDSR